MILVTLEHQEIQYKIVTVRLQSVSVFNILYPNSIYTQHRH